MNERHFEQLFSTVFIFFSSNIVVSPFLSICSHNRGIWQRMHLLCILEEESVVVFSGCHGSSRRASASIEIQGFHTCQQSFRGGKGQSSWLLYPLEVEDIWRDIRSASNPVQIRLSSIDQTIQKVFLNIIIIFQLHQKSYFWKLCKLVQLIWSQTVILLEKRDITENFSKMNDFSSQS